MNNGPMHHGYGQPPPPGQQPGLVAVQQIPAHVLPPAEAVRGPGMSLLLTFITCGFYGLYWQYMRFRTLNSWLGREEHNFLVYFLLSLVTCGIYGMYYEYKFTLSLNDVQRGYGHQVNENAPVISLILAVFGLSVVGWCMQQSEINRLYGQSGGF